MFRGYGASQTILVSRLARSRRRREAPSGNVRIERCNDEGVGRVRGAASVREVQEAFTENARPAYTTVQTTIYRLENKQAVRRVRKISNAHIFEAVVSCNAEQGRLLDELLGLFGERAQPVMALTLALKNNHARA